MEKFWRSAVVFVTMLCVWMASVFTPLTCSADQYIIQSIYQSIRGDNHLSYWEDESLVTLNEHFFHESTTTPVSMRDQIAGGEATLSSNFDTNQFSADLLTGFDFQGYGPDGYNGCYAELDLVFSPGMISQWKFETVSGLPITMEDMTSSVLLFSLTGVSPRVPAFTLYPDHNYRLHMESNGYDEDLRNFASIDATVTRVPEPAGFLFFVLGVMALAAAKKKVDR